MERKSFVTDENEIEEFLLACIFLYPEVTKEINFEDKFFVNKKLLNMFKKVYQAYGYLDIPLIVQLAKDKHKA